MITTTCTVATVIVDMWCSAGLETLSPCITTLIPLTGQFWNIPITIIEAGDGPYIEIYSPGADNYRRIPALGYSLTWDHSRKLCYYVGNSQGGPERSHNPVESVIQGYQNQYETAGLFATSFFYGVFDEAVCM